MAALNSCPQTADCLALRYSTMLISDMARISATIEHKARKRRHSTTISPTTYRLKKENQFTTNSNFMIFLEDLLDTFLERRFSKSHILDHGQHCYCPRYERSEAAYLRRMDGNLPRIYENLSNDQGGLLDLEAGCYVTTQKRTRENLVLPPLVSTYFKFMEVVLGPLRFWIFSMPSHHKSLRHRRHGTPSPCFDDPSFLSWSPLRRNIFYRDRVDHLLGLHKVWDQAQNIHPDWERRGACCFAAKDLERPVRDFCKETHDQGDLQVESIFVCLYRCVGMTFRYLIGREWRVPASRNSVKMFTVGKERALARGVRVF
ncbi:uncharacterized protein BKA78DRAFT_298901 [Phyllosticta capitalensis]